MNPCQFKISFAFPCTFRLLFCVLLFFSCVYPVLEVQAGSMDLDRSRILEFKDALNKNDQKRIEILSSRLRKIGGNWPSRLNFVAGRYHLRERSDFQAAVIHLEKAVESYPLLGDHALFLLSEAYAGIDFHDKAIESLERLINGYPKSPLIQDAMILKAKEHLKIYEPHEAILTVEPLLGNSYTPRENLIRFLMIRSMLDLGQSDRAIPYLKNIYIESPDTPESEEALEMLIALGANSFTFDQRLRRANVLRRQKKFERAERIYQALLKKSPKNPILLKALGKSLFGARKYDKAASVFQKTDSAETSFMETRALYRSGKQQEFMTRLRSAEQRYPELKPRFYNLQLVIALDLRRKGRYEEAGAKLVSLLHDYPSKKRQTLWAIGWNHYARRNFKKAAGVFEKLAGGDAANYPREVYWQARSLERVGLPEQSIELLKLLSKKSPHSFYGYLASCMLPEQPVRLSRWIPPPAPDSKNFRRITELRILGMDEEARLDLPGLAGQVNGIGEALYLGYLAVELGDYRRAIRMAAPLARINPFFDHLAYPRGFWELIEETARRERIEPHLVAAIIREESRFDPKAYSRAGAMGLMQLMPKTAQRIESSAQVDLSREDDLFMPEKNIPLGSHYLGRLVRQFEGNLVFAIAAYNGGENAVRRWINRTGDIPMDEFIEEIPYTETRNYVKKVLKSYMEYNRLWGLTPPNLSVILRSGEPRKF